MESLGSKSTEVDPTFNIKDEEFKTEFIRFCSLICLLHNKKLNLANIFLFVLKESTGMKLYKACCDFDTDFEAVKCFLQYDGSLYKSKYIKKYLNATQKNRSIK